MPFGAYLGRGWLFSFCLQKDGKWVKGGAWQFAFQRWIRLMTSDLTLVSFSPLTRLLHFSRPSRDRWLLTAGWTNWCRQPWRRLRRDRRGIGLRHPKILTAPGTGRRIFKLEPKDC